VVLSGLALSGCYSPPASDEAFEESVVLTKHDEQADFASFKTFFLRPEIRILAEDGAGMAETVSPAVAAPLLQATEQNLIDRGYEEASTAEGADLAVELMYLRSIYSQTYCYNWYYWWDYAYWGYSYYYPPYVSCDTAAWRSGMMVTNVTDLKADGPPVINPEPPTINPPPTTLPPTETPVFRRGVWLSGIYGVEIESTQYVTQRTVVGIDQSFVQSPYFSALVAEPK
jgi:hypothetical protein